jgi:hypothetical protein
MSAAIWTAAMRQVVMPDHEVPGFCWNRPGEGAEIVRSGISLRGKVFEPFFEFEVKAGNALECALLSIGVG